VGGQQRVLDTLGNWVNFRTDNNGNGVYIDAGEQDTRSHDQANEQCRTGFGNAKK
jgi:hypothetical protein